MSEHTPGPWIEESAMSSAKHIRDILQAGGNIVLAMVGGEIQSEALANARLIAAAPDLLEACRDAMKFLDSMATPITGFQQENRRAFRKIVADATAKATT